MHTNAGYVTDARIINAARRDLAELAESDSVQRAALQTIAEGLATERYLLDAIQKCPDAHNLRAQVQEMEEPPKR